MFYLKAKVVPRSKTHHLGYEKQSIGAVYVKSHSLFPDTHKTCQYALWAECRISES